MYALLIVVCPFVLFLLAIVFGVFVQLMIVNSADIGVFVQLMIVNNDNISVFVQLMIVNSAKKSLKIPMIFSFICMRC
jgi:hypothetical protein